MAARRFRRGVDPYKVLVSEMMLQQTQVARVIPKFNEFLVIFPSVHVLAVASLGEVLAQWSGLGYNRRAMYLHRAAQQLVKETRVIFPKTLNALTKLSGIGPNTAGAIMAYAYNQPVAFVETNIRTVYIHHFFASSTDKISDKRILDLVQQTLPETSIREWYWALMDYGTYLKKTQASVLNRSTSYNKQSSFKGSSRQIRGQVIRLLVVGTKTEAEIVSHIPDERLVSVLQDLTAEGLIAKTKNHYRLT